MTPVVTADGGVFPTEGHSKDILADARERSQHESRRCGGRGGHQGMGKYKMIAEYVEAALETGDTHVRGEPHGETT